MASTNDDRDAARVVEMHAACAWVAAWMHERRGELPPWQGPPEVEIFAQRVVIALGPPRRRPTGVTAAPGHRFRLCVTPGASPPVSLLHERDDGLCTLAPAVFIPPSLSALPMTEIE